MNFREWRATTTGLIIALCIAVGGALALSDLRNRQDRLVLRNCRQIEIVKTEIRRTVTRSLTTIPTLEYYKTHPKERDQALDDVRETIKQFAERPCTL